MSQKIEVTEVQIWPVRDAESSRLKAMVTLTFCGVLRVSGCRIIEGARGLFVSYPSEKKPGTDQYFPLFHVLDRVENVRIQDEVLKRYDSMVHL